MFVVVGCCKINKEHIKNKAVCVWAGSCSPCTGDGTAHGHGFVALANVYQYSTLEDIATLITSNARNLSPGRIVERITAFMEHLQREDHFDDAEHQKNLESVHTLRLFSMSGIEH